MEAERHQGVAQGLITLAQGRRLPQRGLGIRVQGILGAAYPVQRFRLSVIGGQLVVRYGPSLGQHRIRDIGEVRAGVEIGRLQALELAAEDRRGTTGSAAQRCIERHLAKAGFPCERQGPFPSAEALLDDDVTTSGSKWLVRGV